MEVAATIRASFANLTVTDGFTLEERKKSPTEGGGGALTAKLKNLDLHIFALLMVGKKWMGACEVTFFFKLSSLGWTQQVGGSAGISG